MVTQREAKHMLGYAYQDLIVCETATATWHYHLRIVGFDGPKFGGAYNMRALCGRTFGWDTKVPVSAYGRKGHLPEVWCEQCQKIAIEKGYKVPG